MANRRLTDKAVSAIDQLDAANFSTTSFIDLIAWQTQPSKTLGGSYGKGQAKIPPIDAEGLLDRFDSVLSQVKEYVNAKSDEIKQAEKLSMKAEEKFRRATADAQRLNVEAIEKARELEHRIDSISKKIGSFGDAVELVNRPRNNLQTSLDLLRTFDRFYSVPAGHEDDIIQQIPPTLPELVKYAETTLALQAATEQLSSDKFKEVKRRIQTHYDLVQQRLNDNFLQLANDGNTVEMLRVTTVLSRFRIFPKSVEQFVETFVKNNALFDSSRFAFCVVSVSLKAHQAIKEAFPHPQDVFRKYLDGLFSEQIQPYVRAKLQEAKNMATGLDALYVAYTETDKIRIELCGKFPTHAEIIQTMHSRIFEKHADNYFKAEELNLAEECSTLLKQMYSANNHVPNVNVKNDVQSASSTVGRLLGPSADTLPPPGKTLVSQQTALDIVQKHRRARDRCRILTTPSIRQEVLVKIYDSLLKWILDEMLLYAVLIGILRVQLADGAVGSSKGAPDLTFFSIVCEVNEIFQLLDKELAENFVVTITSPALRATCINKRLQKVRDIETHMNTGLDKQLGLIVGHVRYILSNEQKKFDFRPEEQTSRAQDKSEACEKVCVYLSRVFQDIDRTFDGLNRRIITADISLRFFHTIFNHMFSFSYNTTGGDQLLVDVTAYNDLIRSMTSQQTPFLEFLFTVLHSLCLMLIVESDKLPSVFSKCDGLSQIDKQTIIQFLNLRADAKQPKVKDALERLIHGV